jgi:hypothetical protein
MSHCSRLMSVLVMAGGIMQTLYAQQRARVVVPAKSILPMAGGTTLSAISAAPGTISFTATDPDLGSFAGNSSATISWTTSGGSAGNTWNLKVHAAAASFTNCATVPRSAIRVSCGGVTGGSAGACGGAITLSGASQQIASGKESSSTGAPYSVTLNFTLADSWSYIAKQAPSCTLSLTYTVTAP